MPINLTDGERALLDYLVISAEVSGAEERRVMEYQERRSAAYKKWIELRADSEPGVYDRSIAALEQKITTLPQRG